LTLNNFKIKKNIKKLNNKGQLPYATDEDESRYSRSLVDIVCKQFYRPPIPYNTPAYIADLFVDMWSPQVNFFIYFSNS